MSTSATEKSATPTPSYGWLRCVSCNGSGTTRHFRGTSLTITHLARGGSPSQLPCNDCRGNGRSWGILPESTERRNSR